MKIKSFIVFAFTFSVLFLMSRCEDEKPVPRDYPRLNTFPVTNISDSGALVTGEIYSLGIQDILEYGFVWGKSEQLLYYTNDKVILGTPQSTGSFSAFISSTLVKGTTYWVRPFARTSEVIVYGKAISFTSLGSLAPLITGFYPDSARWGDTITIRGKRFSWVTNKNLVKLNGILCYQKSSTDTSVTVQIPNSLNSKESLLVVEIEGNAAPYLSKKFRLIMPELADFTPKQGRWEDTILITGKCLSTISSQGNSVKIGSSNCTFVRVSDDSVWVRVPNEVSAITNGLTLNINGISLAASQNFQLLEPYFTFTPSEGTWGSKITLSGRFNAIAARNSFYIGGRPATVAYSNAVKAEIIVPSGLVNNENQVKYKATPFEINSVNKFVLLPPQVASFSPASGAYNTLVTITGNYFGSSTTPVVKFGTIQANVSSWTSTQIKAYVPNTGYGPVKISVTIGNQNAVSTSDFMMQNPRITGFSPQSGTFGDQITISGENLVPSGLSVKFGDSYADVVSSTSSTVIVKVPSSIDSIPKTITINNSNGTSASSSDKFTLLPPEIYSISPSTLTPGAEVTITGKNFNPVTSREFVFFDMVPFKIISASPSQIIASVPSGLPRGAFSLKVQVNGYTRFSGSLLSSNSQWLRIPSPKIRTYDDNSGLYIPIAGAGLSGSGYLCSLLDGGETYRFDSSSKTWTKLLSKPANVNGYMWNFKSQVCNGSLYLIYGSAPVFTMFSANSETWTSINKSLGYNQDAVTFALNNKIYFGTNSYYNLSYPFYEIDPQQGYAMKSLKNFPVSISGLPSACFSYNNIGYVLFGDNNFWKYDPVTDLWTKLMNFPGTRRAYPVSFVLDQYAYVVGGSSTNGLLNDVWRYDPVNNSWLLVSYMPVARQGATAFTLNGKAYIGYGLAGNTSLFDFYEYDPNY